MLFNIAFHSRSDFTTRALLVNYCSEDLTQILPSPSWLAFTGLKLTQKSGNHWLRHVYLSAKIVMSISGGILQDVTWLKW